MNNGYVLSGENLEFSHFSHIDSLVGISGDHCHDRYEITYVISPTGRYIVEGSEHKVVCGSVMLITPMSYHRVIFDDASNAEIYTVHFSENALPEGIRSILFEVIKDCEMRGRIYSPALVSEAIVSAFERLSVAKELRENERAAYLSALLSEIVILLSAAEGERMVGDEDDLGERVAKYINGSIEKNVSLDKLARRFFVSKYYLCRAFKAYAGISVHAYINQKRIIRAKQLIDSGLTASGAAERVGFGDYSAFYRAYIKVFGKSPTTR